MIRVQLTWVQRDAYRVHVVSVPRRWEAIEMLSSWICAATAHRLERLNNRIAQAAWNRTVTLASHDIDRNAAYVIDRRFVKIVERDWQ